jgi:hypothetical protein
LVRQLLYDFRQWRELEATGRSGTDGGFDARGWELTSDLQADEVADSEAAPEDLRSDRQWLIQCKREKAISPKKLTGYLDGLPDVQASGLYGLVFVAACDFSMAARNAFRERARALGFQEARLWGKAELEDALFQPKNDHLLFAYFGVSLQIRKRSVRSKIRSRMAAKRKAKKAFDGMEACLILDGTDDRYPTLDPNETLSREQRGRWSVWEFERHSAYGMLFRVRRHFAFIDDDQLHWDFAETMNDAFPHNDPWDDDKQARYRGRAAAMTRWDSLEKKNKAWFEVSAILPYDALIDIDEEGDDFFDGPIIYVDGFMPDGTPPFDEESIIALSAGDWGYQAEANNENRASVFERRESTIGLGAQKNGAADEAQ